MVNSGKSVSIAKRTAPQWQLPMHFRNGRFPMTSGCGLQDEINMYRVERKFESLLHPIDQPGLQ